MMPAITMRQNHASVSEMARHLQDCDTSFVPLLSQRVDIGLYAGKLVTHAECFEAWSTDRLLGCVALYCNATDRGTAFISNVSVLPDCTGQGLARALLSHAVAFVALAGFARVALEVHRANKAALALYRGAGFHEVPCPDAVTTGAATRPDTCRLELSLRALPPMADRAGPSNRVSGAAP